jgi:hypothetical protein
MITYYDDDEDDYLEDDHNQITLLCGNTASFDTGSGISYRCNYCNATVGSIGMPRACKELYDMEKVVDKLKGKK